MGTGTNLVAAWFLLYAKEDASPFDKASGPRKLADALRILGLRVGGYHQNRVETADCEVVGWDIEAVDASETLPLARESIDADLCKWAFDAAVFGRARQLATEEDVDVSFVGGIGKLECAKRGHWPAIDTLMNDQGGAAAVLFVRRSCLSTVVLRLPDPLASLELPSDDDELAQLAHTIAEHCRARTQTSNK